MYSKCCPILAVAPACTDGDLDAPQLPAYFMNAALKCCPILLLLLTQMVTWMAEERQLMANSKKPARGTVIEAHLDKKIGPVATLLVQAGTLKVGRMNRMVLCWCS
jgi:hypothetical protein